MKRLCILVILLAVPSMLHAHVYIRSVEPAEGAVLSGDDAPGKVTMSFVGSLETAFSGIEVFDGEGKKVSGKTVFSESDSVMEVELDGPLPPGEYTVKWRCMSLDGHSQKGSYTFTVK